MRAGLVLKSRSFGFPVSFIWRLHQQSRTCKQRCQRRLVKAKLHGAQKKKKKRRISPGSDCTACGMKKVAAAPRAQSERVARRTSQDFSLRGVLPLEGWVWDVVFLDKSQRWFQTGITLVRELEQGISWDPQSSSRLARCCFFRERCQTWRFLTIEEVGYGIKRPYICRSRICKGIRTS